jgi:glycosyltransferase involved in cell wall biosynthesis
MPQDINIIPAAPTKTPGAWTVGFNISLWTNQHLMKDVGLVPYMFHRFFGFAPGLLGCAEGDFPYLDVLPGLRLECLPEPGPEYSRACMEFLRGHYWEMDLLCLFGPYPFYYDLLKEYRSLNPDGKVYMALDANIHWTDRIEWTSEWFMGMMDSCDVIATSCRKLQRHLNRKWNRWAINYIPNGFYNPTGREVEASPELKENIILTVGRIGSPEKANHVLLDAFARVHSELPGWSVRLVGGVEEDFKPYIEAYFAEFPELREKVIFTGLIEDKAELYAEYAKARIFALTSPSEGGAPNVIAEALFHGCYTVTSNVDAAEDITNNSECGKIFAVNDAGGMAAILREICPDEALLTESFGKIQAYARNAFDWEVIIKRLHHMLYN